MCVSVCVPNAEFWIIAQTEQFIVSRILDYTLLQCGQL